MIISTLKQSGQSLYDNLPSGKNATDSPSKTIPHSPLSKSITTLNVSDKTPIHRAASTTSTVTLGGIPIKDPYKPIESLKFLKANNVTPASIVNQILQPVIIIYNVSNYACLVNVHLCLHLLIGPILVLKLRNILVPRKPLLLIVALRKKTGIWLLLNWMDHVTQTTSSLALLPSTMPNTTAILDTGANSTYGTY